jgi:hypothetical protein
MDRRDVLRPALFGALGGLAGLLISKYSGMQDKDSISALVRRDREVLAELDELKVKMGLKQNKDEVDKGGQKVEREDMKDGKDGDKEINPAVDSFFELFSIGLVGSILTAQVAFLAKEYQKVQAYRSAESDVQPSWSELIQYRLDLFLTRNPFAKGLIIVNGAFLVILLGALLLGVSEHENIGTALWDSWTYVADPGTQAQTAIGDKSSLRPLALMITVLGLVTFALLVGLVTESVTEQVDSFKKGLSKVLERDHILMIGWTDKSLSIISQLAFANDSMGGTTIVVLAGEEKEDMENELQNAVQNDELNLYNSKVIFRSGDSMLQSELFKVGISRARSIIVLSESDMEPEDADSFLLRQALSISGSLANVKNPPHCTLEIQDVDNLNLVSLVNLNSEIIVTNDIVGQIMVSCSREPGLAFLLEQAVSFQGSEFYFNAWPQLYGEAFGSLTCRFDEAVVLGMKTADGYLLLNPPRDTVYAEGDLLIVMAEDDDSYKPNKNGYQSPKRTQRVRREQAEAYEAYMQTRFPTLERRMIEATQTLKRSYKTALETSTTTLSRASSKVSSLVTGARDASVQAETAAEQSGELRDLKEIFNRGREADKTLFIGWRRDMADMIQALDGTVEPGSELWLFNTVPVEERFELLRDKGNKGPLDLRNLIVKNAFGNPTQRKDLICLKSLDEFGDPTGEELPMTAFDSTLIMADQVTPDGEHPKP